MRFCQIDGTPLVEAAPPVDPYKTMVARPEDIAAAVPPISASAERGPEPEPAAPSEEVLDIPAADPKKTMYASEEEIRGAMAEADSSIVDVPSAEPEPAPPAFIAPPAEKPVEPEFSKTTPPIPSPFGAPQEPVATVINPEPEPPSPGFSPFNDPAPAVDAPIAQAEWTPPPAAQDQARPEKAMQNPQYQPGSGLPAAGGQNKVLPIVSLIFGILSLCCYFAPLTGLVALITGFLGMKNANNDPANYGGKTLAIVGMILGGLFFFIGLAYYVFLLFFGGMGMMMEMMNQAGR